LALPKEVATKAIKTLTEAQATMARDYSVTQRSSRQTENFGDLVAYAARNNER
jgi:hypothetical protein